MQDSDSFLIFLDMNKWVSYDSYEWVGCHWLLRMLAKNRSHKFYIFFMVDHISSTHNMRKAFWVIRQLMTSLVLLWPLIIFAAVNCSWNFLSIVINPLKEMRSLWRMRSLFGSSPNCFEHSFPTRRSSDLIDTMKDHWYFNVVMQWATHTISRYCRLS